MGKKDSSELGFRRRGERGRERGRDIERGGGTVRDGENERDG